MFIIFEGCIFCVVEGEVVDCEVRIIGIVGIFVVFE